MQAEQVFLDSIYQQFSQYKNLAEKCFDRLNEEEFNRIPAPGANSIAVLIRHMAGNLKSRFTEFLTEDGEKAWRNREEEFKILPPVSVKDLLETWQAGWDCLFQALESLKPEDLTATITIRSEPYTVISALHRQLAHHASHVGQILLLTRIYRP